MTPGKFRFHKVVLAFILAAAFFVSPVYGATEYTVKKGDSLSRIAKKFNVSIKTLKKENHLTSSKLKAGDTLLIPGSKPKAGKTDGAKEKEVAATTKSVSDENKGKNPAAEKRESREKTKDDTYYTVKKGDTLSSLSKRYSISIAELKELNDLKSSKLRENRTLQVKRIGPRTYTVKKGDTLSKIAKKFGMDVDELKEINEMESSSLRAGQKLFLEENSETIAVALGTEAPADVSMDDSRAISEGEEAADKDVAHQLVAFAKKLINIPYKFGGNSILGIDCSAYVKKVYGFLGIELPRTAREQFEEGEAIEKDELTTGDLVFFRTYASFPSHVGIYLGNNLFIHASSKGKKVRISSLDTPYYVKRFIGAKRLLTESLTGAIQAD